MDVTSLQGLFAIKRGELTIEATLMNEEEANILQAGLPTAAFYLEHLPEVLSLVKARVANGHDPLVIPACDYARNY